MIQERQKFLGSHPTFSWVGCLALKVENGLSPSLAFLVHLCSGRMGPLYSGSMRVTSHTGLLLGSPARLLSLFYLIFLLHVRLDEVSLIFTGGHITSILVEGIRRKILVPGALQCCSPVLPRSPVFLRSLGTCCVYSKIDLTFCSPWGTLAPLLNWLEPKWKLQTNSHSVENSMCLNCSLKY